MHKCIISVHVEQLSKHLGLMAYQGAVTRVLAWSQQFMRKRTVRDITCLWYDKFFFPPQQDECSFVSLRDVERAMIVFEYFCEKMDIFGPLINEKLKDEVNDEFIVLLIHNVFLTEST